MKYKKGTFDIFIEKKSKNYDAIYNAVASFVEENPDGLELRFPSNIVEQPDEAELSEIEVICTRKIIEKNDRLFFDILVNAEVQIWETVRRDRHSDGVRQWMELNCSFDKDMQDFKVLSVQPYNS